MDWELKGPLEDISTEEFLKIPEADLPEYFLQDPGSFSIETTVLKSEEADDPDLSPTNDNNVVIMNCPHGAPDRNNFTGRCDFNLEINSGDTNSKKYLYSTQLNRIYVNMKCNFVLHFKFEAEAAARAGAAFVRATTVFADERDAQSRVQRCVQHAHDAQEADPLKTGNVLHSASAAGAQGVHYCGAPDAPDVWYSLLLRVRGPAPHAFQFACKNSCPGGINRRPIEVIFTLETDTGEVLGRQTVGARVCSCPKRDMHRDEKAAAAEGRPAKRRAAPAAAPAPPPDKRPCLAAASAAAPTAAHPDHVLMPPLEVVSAEVAAAGLSAMLHVTRCELKHAAGDAPAQRRIAASLQLLQARLDDCGAK